MKLHVAILYLPLVVQSCEGQTETHDAGYGLHLRNLGGEGGKGGWEREGGGQRYTVFSMKSTILLHTLHCV